MPVAAPSSLVLRALAEQVANSYQSDFGRPSDLADADKVTLLLSALAEGNYRQTACDIAGINRTTLHNWVKKGEAGESEAAIHFLNALQKVEAIAEAELVSDVRRAGKNAMYWAASMTMLERKMPDKFGRRNEDTTVAKVIVQFGAMEADITIIQTQKPESDTLSLVPRKELAE